MSAQLFLFNSPADQKTFIDVLSGNPLPQLMGLPGMVAITAPGPFTGKSALARFLISRICNVPSVYPTMVPTSETEMQKVLSNALHQSLPYIFFDDVSGLVESPSLATFLSSPQMAYRPLGSDSSKVANVVTRIFIAGNDLSLSEDMVRRTRLISLATHQPALAGKPAQ